MSSNLIPFVLMIYASGGWDSSMVFDNKLLSPHVSQETGASSGFGAGAISYVDHPDRPSVRAFFETYGGNAAIVNGLYSGDIDYNLATRTALGTLPPDQRRYADWMSFYAYSTSPVMPMPHVVINAPWMPGAYASIAVSLTDDFIDTHTQPPPPGHTLGIAGETALSTFRKNIFSKLFVNVSDRGADGNKLSGLFYSYSRKENVDQSLTNALTGIGDTSTVSPFVRNGKLAIELFAQGSSRAVTLQAGAREEWDTTTNHYPRQSALFENLFSGLMDIMEFARTRGVADNMIVIVTSERGRSPRLNSANGKDAWPYTSALVWGSIIKGGSTVGVTDDYLRGGPFDPIFGRTLESGAPIDIGHIMSALYLKTNVPTRVLLPDHRPLSPILKVDD